jgi:putative SOS response-associated peptidase YedK
MCGRFTDVDMIKVIEEEFELDEITFDYKPNYNIAPGYTIGAIINDGKRKLVGMKWGLIPSWAKDASIGYKMINARAETITKKPSFRSAFKKRRCLIVASGFYEWQKSDKEKIPFYIHLKSRKPFAFAGLFEHWISPQNEHIDSCTIITTEANEMMKQYHQRMPVIIPIEHIAVWLNPEIQDENELLPLLKPFPSDEMDAYPVSKLVNTPRNNSPACIKRGSSL